MQSGLLLAAKHAERGHCKLERAVCVTLQQLYQIRAQAADMHARFDTHDLILCSYAMCWGTGISLNWASLRACVLLQGATYLHEAASILRPVSDL